MLQALLFTLALAAAQAAPAPMKARLSPVPVDATTQAAITGLGSATATLSGTTLTIEGSYKGLQTAATTVKVFQSPQRGLRGPLVGQIAIVGGGTAGTFSGTVALTREQATMFTMGLLYVQLQSEKAPDGNLWGWLLTPKGRR
ncbi:MAG: CHRD domain-containing protein [Vicinamibacterales bacterium]